MKKINVKCKCPIDCEEVSGTNNSFGLLDIVLAGLVLIVVATLIGLIFG